ncbi:MAG: hypothetical protein LBO71_08650 [Prevotellaceae bacterium]|jgi:hypothetical protein|nr:hypothetical protein [Prevotellaceae bacterium]
MMRWHTKSKFRKGLFFSLAFLSLLPAGAQAQYRKAFAVSGGGGHGLTLWDKGEVYRSNRAGIMQMAELSLKAGCYLTPRFELGGSLSAVGYYNADVSAFVLSLTTQYDVTPRLFVGVDAGLPLSMGIISEGVVANAGAGYRLWQHSSGWSLNASLAYRFMDYACLWDKPYVSSPIYEERFNHGLFAGFRLEYTFASTLPQGEREVMSRRQKRKEYWIGEIIRMLFDLGSSAASRSEY